MAGVRLWVRRSIIGIMLLAPVPLVAQTPAAVTATCKDGSSFSGATRSGACKGHGGVKLWSPAATATPPTTKPGAAPVAPAAPVTPNGVTPTVGQVWVNTSTKVYHCAGDRYYGKTKHGKYLSEADAKAQGDRPSNGKACS
jgi:hypothetical protein